MNFIILEPNNKATFEQFVDFWSRFYITNQKDPEKEQRLEELYKRIYNVELRKEDMVCLYKWKNGGRDFYGLQGRTIDRLIKKIGIINNLKTNFDSNFDSNLYSGVFEKEFSFIQGAIWKIFLLHIINLKVFPIFDQHVYRACCFLQEGKIRDVPNSNKLKERFYRDVYIRFFNELAGKGDLRKKLDEALWAFGKFLKTPYGKMIC